jgi:hypothetical protein
MQRRQYLVIVREFPFVQLAPTDDAVPVDDKDRTLAHAVVLVPYTELLCNRAFRMEISKQRVGEAAQLLGPRPMSRYTIYTDAQNLGACRLEARMVALEGVYFGLSAAGKVKRVEGEDHMLAPEVRQTDLFWLSSW